MSYRAGIILVLNNKVALIERHRAGLHYFTFPGGHVEKGETPERTAVRETEEELGLQVTLKQLVAQYGWQGKWQYYYLVEVPSDLDAGVRNTGTARKTTSIGRTGGAGTKKRLAGRTGLDPGRA
jgi:8-oxo-dGTP pyrophosphatase MutT (NUDIX family)